MTHGIVGVVVPQLIDLLLSFSGKIIDYAHAIVDYALITFITFFDSQNVLRSFHFASQHIVLRNASIVVFIFRDLNLKPRPEGAWHIERPKIYESSVAFQYQ